MSPSSTTTAISPSPTTAAISPSPSTAAISPVTSSGTSTTFAFFTDLTCSAWTAGCLCPSDYYHYLIAYF